jgi:hypothetical protein
MTQTFPSIILKHDEEILGLFRQMCFNVVVGNDSFGKGLIQRSYVRSFVAKRTQ